MARRFTPVSDPEKARCEQDEESLRKHRQFDTPFTLLKSNLNDTSRPGNEDFKPLGRPSEDLEQDEHGLWRKKAELFDKQKTWGRETSVFSDPEQARSEGNTGPKWGRPGVVGWGTQGRFGGRGEDKGLSVLQRGEVDQAMEKNEKGLWVRKKADSGTLMEGEPASKGHWRCSSCGLETSVSLEFCRKFECTGLRPKSCQDPAAVRQSNPNEDPRLEAAKLKSRGTQDAAKQALRALEERRRKEQREKERLGMMRRIDLDSVGDAGAGRSKGGGRTATLNSSSQQVRPAPRLKHMKKWQGVQRSDEEAQRIVAKAVGGATAEVDGNVLRVEDSEMSSLKRAPRRSEEDAYGDIAECIENRAREEAEDDGARRRPTSRSRSPRRSSGSGGGGGAAEDVVVDFF